MGVPARVVVTACLMTCLPPRLHPRQTPFSPSPAREAPNSGQRPTGQFVPATDPTSPSSFPLPFPHRETPSQRFSGFSQTGFPSSTVPFHRVFGAGLDSPSPLDLLNRDDFIHDDDDDGNSQGPQRRAELPARRSSSFKEEPRPALIPRDSPRLPSTGIHPAPTSPGVSVRRPDPDPFDRGGGGLRSLFDTDKARRYSLDAPSTFEKPISQTSLPDVHSPIRLDLSREELERVAFARNQGHLPPSRGLGAITKKPRPKLTSLFGAPSSPSLSRLRSPSTPSRSSTPSPSPPSGPSGLPTTPDRSASGREQSAENREGSGEEKQPSLGEERFAHEETLPTSHSGKPPRPQRLDLDDTSSVDEELAQQVSQGETTSPGTQLDTDESPVDEELDQQVDNGETLSLRKLPDVEDSPVDEERGKPLHDGERTSAGIHSDLRHSPVDNDVGELLQIDETHSENKQLETDAAPVSDTSDAPVHNVKNTSGSGRPDDDGVSPLHSSEEPTHNDGHPVRTGSPVPDNAGGDRNGPERLVPSTGDLSLTQGASGQEDLPPLDEIHRPRSDTELSDEQELPAIDEMNQPKADAELPDKQELPALDGINQPTSDAELSDRRELSPIDGIHRSASDTELSVTQELPPIDGIHQPTLDEELTDAQQLPPVDGISQPVSDAELPSVQEIPPIDGISQPLSDADAKLSDIQEISPDDDVSAPSSTDARLPDVEGLEVDDVPAIDELVPEPTSGQTRTFSSSGNHGGLNPSAGTVMNHNGISITFGEFEPEITSDDSEQLIAYDTTGDVENTGTSNVSEEEQRLDPEERKASHVHKKDSDPGKDPNEPFENNNPDSAGIQTPTQETLQSLPAVSRISPSSPDSVVALSQVVGVSEISPASTPGPHDRPEDSEQRVSEDDTTEGTKGPDHRELPSRGEGESPSSKQDTDDPPQAKGVDSSGERSEENSEDPNTQAHSADDAAPVPADDVHTNTERSPLPSAGVADSDPSPTPFSPPLTPARPGNDAFQTFPDSTTSPTSSSSSNTWDGDRGMRGSSGTTIRGSDSSIISEDSDSSSVPNSLGDASDQVEDGADEGEQRDLAEKQREWNGAETDDGDHRHVTSENGRHVTSEDGQTSGDWNHDSLLSDQSSSSEDVTAPRQKAPPPPHSPSSSPSVEDPTVGPHKGEQQSLTLPSEQPSAARSPNPGEESGHDELSRESPPPSAHPGEPQQHDPERPADLDEEGQQADQDSQLFGDDLKPGGSITTRTSPGGGNTGSSTPSRFEASPFKMMFGKSLKDVSHQSFGSLFGNLHRPQTQSGHLFGQGGLGVLFGRRPELPGDPHQSSAGGRDEGRSEDRHRDAFDVNSIVRRRPSLRFFGDKK